MKKIYILLVVLFLSPGLKAQMVKTIENVAGKLDSLLTQEELNTITDLTITGTMDARDFYTIRILMSAITSLDISEVTIVAFSGTDPTLEFTAYEANVIPNRALQWKRKLSTLLLPSSITAIDIGACWGCEALTSVTVPASVTRIGDAAFMDCGLLKTVSLPSALTTIGVQAFDMCKSLTSLSIPSAVTYIGDNAFRQCSSIQEMVIPSSVTVLEKGTFSECSSLTSIILPSTVSSIGENAFFRCSSLTSIDLPSSLTAISDNCFSGCTALEAVVLPSSVISIGVNAFLDCSSLISITIPSSASTIGNNAFSGCSALKEIELPAALKALEPSVFYLCSSLSTVEIPQSVTYIGNSAFEYCNSLVSVVIPFSVDHIGSYAFEGCTNIKNIWSYRSAPVPIDGTVFYSLDRTTCTLHVPFGSEAYYAAAEEWKDFMIISDTTGFGISANSLRFEVDGGEFQVTVNATMAWQASSDQPWVTVSPVSGNINGTVTVTAQSNSTSIFRFARITFTPEQGDPQVITVTQKSTPVVIPVTAGNLLYALTPAEMDTITSLTLTGTINVNDINVLQGFPKLTYLDLTNTQITSTTTYYGYYDDNWWPGPTIWKNSGNIGGFSSRSVKTIKLPNTVVILGCGAFSGSGITTLIIPPSVTTIGWEAFTGCHSLESITIPATVKSFNQWVFSDCSALKEVVVEASWMGIPRGTFAGCSSLTSVILPPTLKGIEMSAFYGCSSLTTLDLPALVTDIEGAAFFGCTGLTTINSYNPFPPSIGDNFREVYATCQLNVPYGSAALYAEAEGWKNFTHIVEMTPFTLSASAFNMETVAAEQSLQITTNEAWSAVCDQEWLTVSPTSGNATQAITFSCQQNMAFEPRTATVTFSDGKGYTQTVIITQKARVNTIPLANAGPDQQVEEGTMVQLDGMGSSDADGDGLTYNWRAPDEITLSATNDAKPSFTAPGVKRDTTYTFKLVVNDGKENSVSDQVLISVTHKSRELTLSADTVVLESRESSSKIMVFGNVPWTISSDHDWLSVTPLSGEDSTEITLTALANEASAERKTTVTVSSTETGAQTLIIIQHGLITGMHKRIKQEAVTCYPNPFTSEMSIEIANPSFKEVNAEVYSISGQKIKTLLRAQKGAKINCTWDGTNEMGQMMPDGMYLLKVNGEVRKVVKD